MFRTIIIAASVAVLTLSATAFAQQDRGTADEAKAMLTKTVSAMKADKAKTLDLINEGKGGFLDRDLYPFCFNLSDGKSVAVASPNSKQTLGMDVRTLKDATGMLFGPDLYAAAKKPEGEITEVSYMWPRTGSDKTPAAKVSFVTKVGNLGCGGWLLQISRFGRRSQRRADDLHGSGRRLLTRDHPQANRSQLR
jgi:hypothetical protein